MVLFFDQLRKKPGDKPAVSVDTEGLVTSSKRKKSGAESGWVILNIIEQVYSFKEIYYMISGSLVIFARFIISLSLTWTADMSVMILKYMINAYCIYIVIRPWSDISDSC